MNITLEHMKDLEKIQQIKAISDNAKCITSLLYDLNKQGYATSVRCVGDRSGIGCIHVEGLEKYYQLSEPTRHFFYSHVVKL
jgi:hypothetical protein